MEHDDDDEDGALSEEHVYPIWARSSDNVKAICEVCGAIQEQCRCYGAKAARVTDKLNQRRVSYHGTSLRYRPDDEADDMTYDTPPKPRRHSLIPSDTYKSNATPSELTYGNLEISPNRQMPSEFTDTFSRRSPNHRPDGMPSAATDSIVPTTNTVNKSKELPEGSDFRKKSSPLPRDRSKNIWNDRTTEKPIYSGSSQLSQITSQRRPGNTSKSPTAYFHNDPFDRRSQGGVLVTEGSGAYPLQYSSGSKTTDSYDTSASSDSRVGSESSRSMQDSNSLSPSTRGTVSRSISTESESDFVRRSYTGTSGSYCSSSYSGSLSNPSSCSIVLPESHTSLSSNNLNWEGEEELKQAEEQSLRTTDGTRIEEGNESVYDVNSAYPVDYVAPEPLNEDSVSKTSSRGRHEFATRGPSPLPTSSYVPVMEGIPEVSGTDSLSTSVSNTSMNDNIDNATASRDPVPMEKIPEVSGTESASSIPVNDTANESSLTFDTKF